MQKFEINVTGSYFDAAMLRQISEGVWIDQVPEGSLMNSKNEWNYFHVACAVVGRDSWYRIYRVGLHDTGEQADYFSASYMKILLTGEARRAQYISRISKLHFYFHILHFLKNVCRM